MFIKLFPSTTPPGDLKREKAERDVTDQNRSCDENKETVEVADTLCFVS